MQDPLFPAPKPPASFWIATISRDHVQRGQDMGILQVCHGKRAPLARLNPGDRVFCYSPRTQRIGGVPLQALTAIGDIADGTVYQVQMGPGFHPFRREVHWHSAVPETPIRPLLSRLSFGQGNWGLLMRRGLFRISPQDAKLISAAMTSAS